MEIAEQQQENQFQFFKNIIKKFVSLNLLLLYMQMMW
jgi:hypothetical protein